MFILIIIIKQTIYHMLKRNIFCILLNIIYIYNNDSYIILYI